jgi:methionyl-tRNA formyltransferase
MEKLKIIFMGTPAFAVGILENIHKNYEVAAVVTVADKPAGRGQKISESAVKLFAVAHHIPVLQPTNLKDEKFIETLKSFQANLFVVVAFRMLPQIVWQMPKFGTFNLHASLLPHYRGAAPINWAIINGEKETGVTTFFIDDKIDTGNIILSKKTAILPNENVGSLHDRLMTLGAQTVLETLHAIETNTYTTTNQNIEEEYKTAYKLNKDNCKIDWEKSGAEIINLINGLSPYPAAWTNISNHNQTISAKIYQASFLKENHDLKIGTIEVIDKNIKVAITNGFIILEIIHIQDKKKMAAKDLLNGYTFHEKAYVY